MDDPIAYALAHDRTIDITTTGRRSGQPRRIEIWFHNLDGRLFIGGPPGKRDWYANLRANPTLTFHIKQSVRADLPARAVPVTDDDERRAIVMRILDKPADDPAVIAWVERGPLVEILLQP